MEEIKICRDGDSYRLENCYQLVRPDEWINTEVCEIDF